MVMPSFIKRSQSRVDVVDLVGEVAEIAIFAIFLLFPIVGQLDQRRTANLGKVFNRPSSSAAHRNTNVNFALSLSMRRTSFRPKASVEFQRGIEFADAQHGVKITHFLLPGEM